MRRRYLIDGQTHEVAVTRGPNGALQIERAGRCIVAIANAMPDGSHRLTIDDRSHAVLIAMGVDAVYMHSDVTGTVTIETVAVSATAGSARGAAGDVITAPMPGTVVAVHVVTGQSVATGQPLMVIESMKLETTLSATRDARVKAIHFDVGSTFALKAKLVTLEDVGVDGTTPA